MTSVPAWIAQLSGMDPLSWAAFLDAHSGLPGPRADLALVDAAARTADAAVIDALLRDGREYPVMCAAAALGRRAGEPRDARHARALAADDRWRVREGVAIGLQLLGDDSPAILRALVADWVDDPDPLVQRAAVAAICEPRLLRTPDAARAGLAACARATAHLAAADTSHRRQDGARTLRQALGYCWSVAIAADPVAGLPVFAALDESDPDVAWIIRENRKKKRLATLLSAPAARTATDGAG